MRCHCSTLISLLLLIPVTASADTLMIDSVNQNPKANGLSQATRGMTMAQVERKFGAPSNKLAAVGEPPITRWIYNEYTVYFEHHLVLTSVINR
jgi:hypothetical protein